MSCFDGIILEYPGVSVDCFSGKNLRSNLYFLSHCHGDHMKGLDSDSFASRLTRNAFCYLYCSEFTAMFLRHNPNLKIQKEVLLRLKVLPFEYSHSLDVINDSGENTGCISVTLLPAGHCPGSAMFLFDGASGCVLYTGDFRLYIHQIRKSTFMRGVSGGMKTLYLDTTFCDPNVSRFPERLKVIESLVRKIEGWFSTYPSALVLLDCKTELGYEEVFVELEKQFKEKIHVCVNKYRMYQSTSEIISSLTKDNSHSTRFHACYSKSSSSYCQFAESAEKVLKIKLCAMSFALDRISSKLYSQKSQNPPSYNFCFSMHSSHSELVEFVGHVQPAKIMPCAIPSNLTTEKVLSLLPTPMILPTEEYSSPRETGNFHVSRQDIGESNAQPSVESDMYFEEEIDLPKVKRLKNAFS